MEDEDLTTWTAEELVTSLIEVSQAIGGSIVTGENYAETFESDLSAQQKIQEELLRRLNKGAESNG